MKQEEKRKYAYLFFGTLFSFWIYTRCVGTSAYTSVPPNQDISTQLLETEDKDKILSLIRSNFIESPSKNPYKLEEIKSQKLHKITDYMTYKYVYPSWVFIKSIIVDLFPNNTSGFFVEAGAFDGEFLSNSLHLERELGWKGLLVEANRRSYKKLKKKNRKAWTTSLCLAIKDRPHYVSLRVKCSELDGNLQERGGSRIITIDSSVKFERDTCFDSALCVPTSSILESLNISKVDFFSLDIEDSETQVLKNFPFDEIQVDVWAIEHAFRGYKDALKANSEADIIQDSEFTAFMETKGYYLFDLLCSPIADYIFVRTNTDIFRSLQVPQDKVERRFVCKQKGLLDNSIENIPSLLRDPHHFPDIVYKEI